MTVDRKNWRFWIDRGGTFTDVVGVAPDGRMHTLKLLSDNPSQYEDAAVAGIDRLLAAHAGRDSAVESVRMGTTVATNALLERRGARTVFVTTAGFADVLRIGTQQRPDIFALDIRLPDMLYDAVIEASERVDADGRTLLPLDEPALEAALDAAKHDGVRSVAVAFLHGYRFPGHERRAATIARRLGFEHVSASHEVHPLIKLVERGDTTVADAYLTPVLRAYVDGLRFSLSRRHADPELLFMQSHGGLADADQFHGRNSILSGPAGGVVGMAAAARDAGYDEVIGFDMGGTSTDVSVFAGRFERTSSTIIGGVRIAAPMMRINTVAAGGGSVLKYDGGRLRVGPESAGACPGPACYRNGGPLTLTDANVFLGRIQPAHFPAVFGPGADQTIDADAAAARIEEQAAAVSAAAGTAMTPTDLAAGYLRIAIDHMAAAIEQISIQRGHDVTRFALSAFGGAGGQHACRVADALGIDCVLVDPLAGVLSAYGIGLADVRSIASAPIERALDAEALDLMRSAAERLRRELAAELEHARGSHGNLRFEVRCRVKVVGSDTPIAIEYQPELDRAGLFARFDRAYRQRFGFGPAGEAVAVDSIEVEAVVMLPAPSRPALAAAAGAALAIARARAWFDGGWRDVPVFARTSLGAGSRVAGPAIIVEDNATTVVEIGWQAVIDARGVLILTRSGRRGRRETATAEHDPIMLEVFNNQFMHVAEQMGAVLEQTAHSVNIKERLDYSCALFDSAGSLVANAPHVPVHLGSMGDSVRAVLAAAGELRRGDAYVINAPYSGGTHLPDITVVTPIFESGAARPSFVVASRAHHADVGGITPGSMPARSTHIHQEGVVLECTRIVRGEVLLERELRALLAAGRYPARNPDQNVADLKAQLAANAKGADEIGKLIGRFGSRVVQAYMRHVQANAEECMRNAVRRLSEGSHTVELDGGERIEVRIGIDRERGSATIDFAGTGGMSAANFNAPVSIAHAAVLYVFRTLIAEDIPLNAGCLVPLEVTIPPASLLDPRYPAAVVAGNVETSQCIVDALLAALGVCAASQGTMNNFTFGNAEHQYYETLCGGCGAGPGFDGASAVHSHMTNSRLTDVEVLEQRFPVRVRRFEIRRGSGGSGRFRGGDGVLREIEFLEPLEGSILSNRRRTAPFGLEGGGAGAHGRNFIRRSTGEIQACAAAEEMRFAPGDCFVIETPGGGGYGRPAGGPDRLS